MKIDTALVKQAKEKLGDDNALIIAQLMDIPEFDEVNLKCCCPLHNEDTPSFIYDRKRHSFHCFGCQANVDIIDAYMYTGLTYAQAVQELFKKADIKHGFGMLGVKEMGGEYIYPHDEPEGDMSHVIEYGATRRWSEATLRHCGVRQDGHGNMVFRYFDTNDVLTMVKYRPSRPVQHGEAKMWCQKGADTRPLLFNMNRINVSQPLLICEGEGDCLSAIEAGFINATSVPLGAGNLHWIDENWDWLEQFESIILCGDNDKPGQDFMTDALHRLGSWRTKCVELPAVYIDDDGNTSKIKDLNDVLCSFGKQKVMDCIARAKDMPIDSVVDFSDIGDMDIANMDGVYAGISQLDSQLSRLFYGSFNILTGINGCVDCDTEFFNGEGWKYISEYEEGDRVLMYNEDGSTELVYPDEYTKEPCSEMLAFTDRGVDQVVTPEHTMAYVTPNNVLRLEPAAEVMETHETNLRGFNGRFIQTFEFGYHGQTNSLTIAELRLLTAAICVGNYSEQYNREPGNVTIHTPQYKDTRYLQLRCDDAGVSYIMKRYNRRNSIEFKPPAIARKFDGIFWRLRNSQYAAMLEEIKYWRGRKEGKDTIITCRNKYEADFFQFVFATQGEATRIRIIATLDEYGQPIHEYWVQTQPSNSGFLRADTQIKRIKSADGYKYCFTVPSGMFVTRRHGTINVTGNSGKSSFISQLICQCLEQGRDAWLYSMELPNPMAKNWLQYVLAGPHHISESVDARGKRYYHVPPDVKQQIDRHYKGRIYIYKDGFHNTVPDILQSMEDSARKYGCKLFIIDNLTAVNMQSSDNDKWDKQNEFVIKLIDFAKKYDVTVILVIHPRKLEQMRKVSKMDIQGSGGMTDLAHRALSLYRVMPKEKEGVRMYNGDGWKIPPVKHDVLLGVLKDRFTGCENMEVGLFFDIASKRFFTSREEYNFSYGWDKNPVDKSKWTYPARCVEAEEEPY